MVRLTASCIRKVTFPKQNLTSRKRFIAVALIVSLSSLLAPLPVRAAMLQKAENSLSVAVHESWSWLDAAIGVSHGQQDPERKGVRPLPAEGAEEREARVASLEINPANEITLQSGQPIGFTAIPLDAERNTVHGIRLSWRSTDRQVIFVKKNGLAVAGKPGNAVVIARIRNQQASVRVTVIEGTKEPYGGKKKVDSTRSAAEEPAMARNRNKVPGLRYPISQRKRAHAGKWGSRPGVIPFIRNPSEDPLPDNETSSLYQTDNLIGTPPGKTKAGALTIASAVSARESGNKNFHFSLPVANLPGRGIDLSLSLIYNSLVWNKSTSPSTGATWMTYDVDSGYPAQGFRLGFGQIEDQGSAGFTLTEANGTRHALVSAGGGNYDTNDGTFIRFTGGSGWGTLFYPDGTQVFYGAAGGGYRSYPMSIEDRNGNYLLINYVNGVGPRIYSIQDTVGRFVRFYYDSNNDLVAIAKPGLTGQSDLQVMRFYYETVTLPSGLFGSGINVSKPATARVIRYLYLPASGEGSSSSSGDVGYRFDYSQYGMIYQMVKFQGMTASTTSTSSTGTVTEGSNTQAAITSYNYPTSASGLNDLPTFSTRTDDWAGRTIGSAPQYSFAVSEGTSDTTTTVTAPDGAVNVSVSIKNSGAWNNGFVTEKRVQNSSSVVFSKTIFNWAQNSTNGTPRLASIQQTNEAGKTNALVFSYDSTTPYNNISVVSERDFTTNGSISTTELRRTETTYVTSSNYLNRRRLHLPSMIKVFPGGSSTPISRIDYTYDNYGSFHANMTARDDIIMHDIAFDPFQEGEEICDWECVEWGYNETGFYGCLQEDWVCHFYNPYDPNTDYRGNITSVTTYPDATTTAGAITHATTFDIAGNVMTAQVDCCQSQSITYSSTNFDYAYPLTVTKGNPSGLHLTTSFSYDMNTGLVASTTDPNSQVTNFAYNTDTLRLDHVDFADGGQVSYDYFNALAADSAGRLHFSVVTLAKLDSTRYVDSKNYFDGRGALTQTYESYTSGNGWSITDAEYDAMGRAYRTSNPYYCTSNYGSCSINPSGIWTTQTYDVLGRVTQVTMPRGDDANPSLTTTVQTTYEGDVITVTDQTGKQRRKISDALGRLVRVDEPNSSGSLGTVSSPNQSTSYIYDALDNLVKITQGSQERFFKYDSLSRLIRERQVEQATNSAYNLTDSLTGNSSWTKKVEYNSHGLITNTYDARGVQAAYSYDGLNRLTLIDYSDSTPDARYYYDSQTLPTGAPSYTHGYANGRVIAMTYGSSSSITGNYFGYDNMGRINVQKQVTGANTYTLSYTYNLAGQLASETYPTGRVLTHSYDNAGRLSQISDGTTTFTSGLSYAANGAMLSETWGNGAVRSVAYNSALQVSQIKLKQSSSGSELQRYDYLYGQVTQSNGSVDKSKNNGQIGRIDGVINGSGTKEWEQRFSYDELGRLSRAAEFQQGTGSTPSWQQEFTYDRYGNRLQSGANNFSVPFTPVVSTDITASSNRFISTGATPITYDAAGNITQDKKFRLDPQADGMNYTYDANGRQITAAGTDEIGTQNSVYDGAGQRVQTSGNNVTRQSVYDVFGQLVADYKGGSLERENIYRKGQVLAVYEAASTCYKTIDQFIKDFYQGALSRQPNSTELANWTTTLTLAQARGGRALIGAAQDLGNSLFTSTEYINLNTTDTQFVTDLYEAFLQRTPDTSGLNHWVSQVPINGRSNVRLAFAVCPEFAENVTAICSGTSSGTSTIANLKYLLTDAKGTTRALMNNSGNGTSTIIARHDYLPFGEEIWAGVGLRTTTQGYGTTDKARQRFAMLERDEATGLDHTWFRKYDSFAGRWTSPDPYNGSLVLNDPQSLNRYSYTRNDPTNFVDPTGLMDDICGYNEGGEPIYCGNEPPIKTDSSARRYFNLTEYRWVLNSFFGGFTGGGGGLGSAAAAQDNRTVCERMVQDAKREADTALSQNPERQDLAIESFNKAFGMITFGSYFTTSLLGFAGTQASNRNNVLGTRDYKGDSGFPDKFKDTLDPGEDQVHHVGAYFSAGLTGHKFASNIHRRDDKDAGNSGDVELADASYRLGEYLKNNPEQLVNIGVLMRTAICYGAGVPK
jgi:RHS repeat-associated protein